VAIAYADTVDVGRKNPAEKEIEGLKKPSIQNAAWDETFPAGRRGHIKNCTRSRNSASSCKKLQERLDQLDRALTITWDGGEERN